MVERGAQHSDVPDQLAFATFQDPASMKTGNIFCFTPTEATTRSQGPPVILPEVAYPWCTLTGTTTIMGGIMTWAAISCVGFLAFFGLLITSLLKRSNAMVGAAILSLLIAVGTGVGAIHEANNLGPTAAIPVIVPRSGIDMYNAMFGPSVNTCVSVTHHHDRLVPGIDKAIRIRARTCAAELRRVLDIVAYNSVRGSSNGVPKPTGGAYASGDFAPEALGDSVLCHHRELTTNGPTRWIYMRLDSSEMVAVDMME